MSEVQKKWYVLRAISGKEAKVKELLDAEIKNTDLGRYVFQVLIPTEKTYVVRNGKKVMKNDLDQIHIPDPVKLKMDDMEKRIGELEGLLSNLKGEN